jgi:hypothetical protein
VNADFGAIVLPYLPVPSRIAIDIDSTLHHYWDQLAGVVRRRHGVELPYAAQTTWHIATVPEDLIRAAVLETHSEPMIMAAVPYPGAVETLRAWHDAGHLIHVTSHRSPEAHDATARWLARVGVPYDDLYCSYDKVARCVELAIDLLVDDSPVNLMRAREHGIAGATIRHPWNAELCAEDGFICAPDWPALGAALEPRLRDGTRANALAPAHIQEDPV